MQAKKDTQKAAPQAATPAGKAEVEEVSDEEEDDAEYPLDNRFSYLSGNGVPLPNDMSAGFSSSSVAPEVSTKKPQPAAATDQGELDIYPLYVSVHESWLSSNEMKVCKASGHVPLMPATVSVA